MSNPLTGIGFYEADHRHSDQRHKRKQQRWFDT
jgi:hypothetical protein